MLEYCDYIADRIRKGLVKDTADPASYIKDLGPVSMDLHPTDGYMLSTTKTIEVLDKGGKKYRVTVECVGG